MTEEFILIPRAMVHEKMLGDPHVAGGSIPQAIVTGPEIPHHTSYYKNLNLNDRGEDSLYYNAQPELRLKLFNFLQGLYRAGIQHPSPPKNVDEKRTEVKTEERESHLVHVKSLPKVAQSLAPGHINFLTTNTPLKIEATGFITYPDIQHRIHLVDLLKTMLSTKTSVHPDIQELINKFIRMVPTAYIKNSRLKHETGDDEFWDTFKGTVSFFSTSLFLDRSF
jgi:hypothetical protein